MCDGEFDVGVVPISFFGILHGCWLSSLILLVKVARKNNFFSGCCAHAPKGSNAKAGRRGQRLAAGLVSCRWTR